MNSNLRDTPLFCTYESNDPTGGQELCICWRILIEIAWQARAEEDDAFRMGVSVTERATLKYTVQVNWLHVTVGRAELHKA